MLMNIVSDKNFVSMMENHIKEMLIYLFEKEQTFGILCKIEHVDFNPMLPDEIFNEFREVTLFFLAGYTYESARIEEGYLFFEAGFGSENIGSHVSVPLSSIIQIIVDETPLLISLASPKEPQPIQSTAKETLLKDDDGVQNSMAAFLNNPENQKFKK